MAAPAQLTPGAVAELSENTSGNCTLQPVLQVLAVRKVKTNNNTSADRFRMVLSDGVHTLQSMLSTAENVRVRDGTIRRGSIIHLQSFTCCTIKQRRITVIIKLDVLQSERDIIGNPKPYEMINQPNEQSPNLPANAAQAISGTYSSGPAMQGSSVAPRPAQVANNVPYGGSYGGYLGTAVPPIEMSNQPNEQVPNLPAAMSLELLKTITNNFSENQRLGSGTFGTVYKGTQSGKEIAVKLLHSPSQRLGFEEEFMKEFENLRILKHPNIVQLLGYCYEIKRVIVPHEGRYVLADEIHRALCFEYMCNGSLQQHLDDEAHRLDWQTCYKIIKGTCEGLKYLHEANMYHLDLKPGNILLDMDMVPKIADFGLSKLVCNNETQATSSLLGTIGYCPPEYIVHKFVSKKFDVFSLGVVTIEIIVGPKGYCKAAEMPSQEFIDHVHDNWRKRLHATAGCTYECHQVKSCIEMALQCVSADRRQRPSIEDITDWLNLNETENIYGLHDV